MSTADLHPSTVRRAQQGDAAACRQVVLRFQHPVFHLLSRMLSHDVVEDVAQDVFLKVFRALPGFDLDGAAKLSTWVFTIATNAALDVRKKKRLQLVPLDDGTNVVDDKPSAGRADARVQQRQTEHAVERALQTLPDAQRIVLVLSVFHGLPHAEIAAVLGVDVGTVKSRLSRARSALRDQLQEVRHVG